MIFLVRILKIKNMYLIMFDDYFDRFELVFVQKRPLCLVG
jgi:hypothetical protein